MKVCGTVKELHSFLILAVDEGSSCSRNENRRGNRNGAELPLPVYFVGFSCESFIPHSLFVAKFFRKTHPVLILEYGNELLPISS